MDRQLEQKKTQAIFSVGFLAAGIVLAITTSLNKALMTWCFIHISYYLIALLFIAWIIAMIQFIEQEKPDFRRLFKNYGWGVLVSLLLTSFIFISVKPQFRILSDETNLLGVSKSMTFEKTVESVTQGKWIDFNYYPLERQLEKRPFLFPFLVHLLHIFFGYQIYHPFVANFLTLFGIFSIIFIMAKERVGFVAACALLFMIAAQPVVTQTAASGGIDLICVFFMILSLFSLESYLQNPSQNQFRLLWVHFLLLANTRYEAPLYFLTVIVLFVFLKKMDWGYLKASFVYSLTPLIFLPTYWQRAFLETDLQIPEGESAFSIERFLKHNLDFLRSLTQFDNFYPYATLINILAVLALAYFGALFVLKKWPIRNEHRLFVLIAFMMFLSYWIVINAHYLDFFLEPSGSRIWVLAAVASSVMAFVFLYRSRYFQNKAWLLLIISIGFFCLYHTISVENRFFNKLSLTREYRIAMDFLKRQNTRNSLVIAFRPNLYTVHNYGAVDFYYANHHKDELLRELEEHVFSEIFVIQEVYMAAGVPNERTTLDPTFQLETIHERQKDYTTILRFSRVVESQVS